MPPQQCEKIPFCFVFDFFNLFFADPSAPGMGMPPQNQQRPPMGQQYPPQQQYGQRPPQQMGANVKVIHHVHGAPAPAPVIVSGAYPPVYPTIPTYPSVYPPGGY
jgi:hypothetical protein